MGVEERAKVVGDRVFLDCCVEAPGTGRRREHIPERDALPDQRRYSARVLARQVWVLSRDDSPEGVLRTGVVLAALER